MLYLAHIVISGVVSQQFIALYDSCFQIYCNWSRFKPDFNVKACCR